MNATLDLMSRLATTRRQEFSEREVSGDDLALIEAAMVRTANSSNRQAYSVVVLRRDEAARLHLAGSRALVLCVDFHRMRRMAMRLGRPCDVGHVLQFLTATIDTAMLAQSAIVAARSLGIDTWITNEPYYLRGPELDAALELPAEHVVPLLAVCLGYRSEPYGPPKGRLPMEAIFHEGAYREPDERELDAWIARYDDPESHMALVPEWRGRGFDHYLEWFFEKWAPGVGSRDQSDTLLARLRAKGLMAEERREPAASPVARGG